MSGLSIKLPLVQDERDGLYRLNKNIKEVVRQNLKMLVLTNPGERLLIPDYGVGIEGFLFENAGSSDVLHSEIVARIGEQVGLYMPYIEIAHVDFNYDSVDSPHQLELELIYFIKPIQESDSLNVGLILGNYS